MVKINSDCDLNVRLHSRHVVEITAICNNQFTRRVYIGTDYNTAMEKFKKAQLKGEI